MADLQKQTYEERVFAFDFTAKMARQATLVLIDDIDIEPEGLVALTDPVTESERSVSGKMAQAKFSGGADGERYKITFKVTDSDDQKLEGEGFLVVSDT